MGALADIAYQTSRQLVGHLCIDVQAESAATIVGVDDDAVLVDNVTAKRIAYVVIAATDGDMMIVGKSCT